MNVEQLKQKITARRHQLVHLAADGRLLASCETILPLGTFQGQQVLPTFHNFDGMMPAILALRAGDEPIALPAGDLVYQDQAHSLSHEFWVEAEMDGILWLMRTDGMPSRHMPYPEQLLHAQTPIHWEKEETLRDYAARLEKAHLSLQRFTYIVSHDLKAPLRAIGFLTDWIEESIASGDQVSLAEHLQLLRSRVARVEGLVEGIARYHRAGRVQSEPTDVDLRELLLELQATIFTERPCALHLPETLPIFHCCRTALYQVFSNLFSNVAKYGKQDDCQIVIGYEDLGQYHGFSVQDNGPGIDSRHHKRIFEIFQTLQSKDENDSTGIGLSIVQRIVDECGGQVWVESELGKGANFRFTWSKTPPKKA